MIKSEWERAKRNPIISWCPIWDLMMMTHRMVAPSRHTHNFAQFRLIVSIYLLLFFCVHLALLAIKYPQDQLAIFSLTDQQNCLHCAKRVVAFLCTTQHVTIFLGLIVAICVLAADVTLRTHIETCLLGQIGFFRKGGREEHKTYRITFFNQTTWERESQVKWPSMDVEQIPVNSQKWLYCHWTFFGGEFYISCCEMRFFIWITGPVQQPPSPCTPFGIMQLIPLMDSWFRKFFPFFTLLHTKGRNWWNFSNWVIHFSLSLD